MFSAPISLPSSPVTSKALNGMDSLLSIVQMPRGYPVGTMAIGAAEKLIELGAKPVTLSDSSGCIYDESGITREKLQFVMELKNVGRGRIKEYADEFKCEYHEGTGVWHVGGEVARPFRPVRQAGRGDQGGAARLDGDLVGAQDRPEEADIDARRAGSPRLGVRARR